MAFKIEERFQVKAPIDRVWRYLIDPKQVVTCLPGAELTEVVDERTYHGNVKVKVGPVTVSYAGRAHLEEVDAAARRVRMAGEGREKGGAGAARMTMESRIAPLPDGGTEVVVEADLDVAGRIVQFGRGMIGQVAHQLFQQFAECARQTLEAPEAETAAAAVSRPAKPVRAIPLVFKALWASIVGFFRRLFGREKKKT
jgi:carbon monoxide dehydrogenase subunit G